MHLFIYSIKLQHISVDKKSYFKFYIKFHVCQELICCEL